MSFPVFQRHKEREAIESLKIVHNYNCKGIPYQVCYNTESLENFHDFYFANFLFLELLGSYKISVHVLVLYIDFIRKDFEFMKYRMFL